MDIDKIERLRKIINGSKSAVLFTGAGFSVPSGIPDFRSEKGIYTTPSGGKYSPEQMISHSFFMARPEDFFRFYREKLIYPEASFNVAHKYFALLEESGKLKATITQNIDGLHQKAGAKNVFELHGSIYKNYCMGCGKKFGLDRVVESNGVPLCDECGGIVRPDVVLYEENLDEKVIRGAVEAISRADTLIVAGTSLVVYPAAGLLKYFNGKNLVLINKSATHYDSSADLALNEDVAEVAGELIRDFISLYV